LDNNEDAVSGFNDWSEVRDWLESRTPLFDPLGGILESNFWSIVAASSGILREGHSRGFTDPDYFASLEKQQFASTVASGGANQLKNRLINNIFSGSTINSAQAVSAFVRTLNSNHITGETGAAGKSAPYHGYGDWGGSALEYAYPKHVSWKDSGMGSVQWQLQQHHIWPTYLMGPNQLVSVRERLHQVHFHVIESATVPSALGISRSASDFRSEYNAAQQRGPAQLAAFVARTRALLIAVYNLFQARHVVSGNFASHCIGILNSITI
jgi:hypothetical protein